MDGRRPRVWGHAARPSAFCVGDVKGGMLNARGSFYRVLIREEYPMGFSRRAGVTGLLTFCMIRAVFMSGIRVWI